MTAALAFAAAVAAIAAAVDFARAARGPAGLLARSWSAAAAALVESVLRIGREGREPGALERRRLLLVGAGAALAGGWFLAGPLGGAALALAAPTAVARLLRARRRAYRRAVARAAPALALALADALSGGHSVRGALTEAARGAGGAAGVELRRVAAELASGAETDAALTGLRGRARSPAVDAIVTALLVHRRSGGDLAALLRRLADSFEDELRLAGEVRAATAQARFTGWLVAGLPLGGALLAEAVSPGFAAGLAGSPLTAWLVGLALVLQLAAAFLIHRLGRSRL